MRFNSKATLIKHALQCGNHTAPGVWKVIGKDCYHWRIFTLEEKLHKINIKLYKTSMCGKNYQITELYYLIIVLN